MVVCLIPVILGLGEMLLKERQKFKASLGYKEKLNRKRQIVFFFLWKRAQCWMDREVEWVGGSGRSRGKR